jgi:hypothetical protein
LSNCEAETGFGVVLFQSTQGAIGAERLLVSAGVRHKLITVPRHLSSSCGFCLRFVWTDRGTIEGLLAEAKLGVERILAL